MRRSPERLAGQRRSAEIISEVRTMYTSTNFRTKKAVKDAVMLWATKDGPAVTYYQTGPYGGNEPTEGIIYLEGPHFPEPHRWYAQATVEGGKIIKVK
jgi:hypothetical protein